MKITIVLGAFFPVPPSEELECLLERAEVDLVDVRPEREFEKMHAWGARSLPLSKLDPHSFAVAHLGNGSLSLCLMGDRTLRASVAAGLIAGTGLANPRVLEGGLQDWVKQGLPVVEPQRSFAVSRRFAHLSGRVRAAAALFRQGPRLRPA